MYANQTVLHHILVVTNGKESVASVYINLFLALADICHKNLTNLTNLTYVTKKKPNDLRTAE